MLKLKSGFIVDSVFSNGDSRGFAQESSVLLREMNNAVKLKLQIFVWKNESIFDTNPPERFITFYILVLQTLENERESGIHMV